MFYFPGVLKSLDGYWVKRVVMPLIRTAGTDEPVDLIDAHFGYPEGVGCVLAARRLGLPVFITMRGLERQILDCRWRRTQLLWALQQCTGIICVAEALADLARSQGISGEKLRVIPNAVEREIFHSGPQSESKRLLGIAEENRLIVSVAMFERRKGQHLLLEAFHRLHQQTPAVRLALIGGRTHERGYPELIENTVSNLGLQDSVLRPGPQSPERVAAWLRAADLFVLPTSDEGCCNAILEALACGLPVVTTAVGDNARHVAAPERGLVVPVDDAHKLTEAMKAALAKTWDRGSISRYQIHYTWEKVAAQTAAFFRERVQAEKQ
jgi:glycosyltransferase involved in cell wall biosynthesis